MALVNAALSENEIAAAAPNHAERQVRDERDLRRVQPMQYAIDRGTRWS